MPVEQHGAHADLLSDPCAAVHPLALASPFFRSLDLGRHGLRFRHAPIALGHPLPAKGSSVAVSGDLSTVDGAAFGSAA